MILRDPEPHAGRSYLLGAEVASMRQMIAELSVATGALWREDQREPADFFQAVTAAGADPMYMGCVRTIFERTRNGTLPDLAETSETLSWLTQRPATSIRSFLERHRDHFTTDSAQGRA